MILSIALGSARFANHPRMSLNRHNPRTTTSCTIILLVLLLSIDVSSTKATADSLFHNTSERNNEVSRQADQASTTPTPKPRDLTTATDVVPRDEYTESPTPKPRDLTTATDVVPRVEYTESPTPKPRDLTTATDVVPRDEYTESPTPKPRDLTTATDVVPRVEYTESRTPKPRDSTPSENRAERSLLNASPSSPEKPDENPLTQISHNHFKINASLCNEDDLIVFRGTMARIDVVKNDDDFRETQCIWNVSVPQNHNIIVRSLPIDSSEYTDDEVTLSDATSARTISAGDFNREYAAVFNSTVQFRHDSRGEDNATTLSFKYNITKEPPPKKLIASQLTNTTFRLTSPNHDGEHQLYPSDVNTSYVILVPEDHVMFAVFPHLDLGAGACNTDYLVISSDGDSEDVTLCGTHYRVLPHVFHASITLYFVTDDTVEYTGFEMLYSILPQSHEPQRLSDGLYDCSVPYFEEFREVFSCNLVLECQGGEDEEDCAYNNTGCGIGAVNAGNKCYKIFWPEKNLSWYDAFYSCVRIEQNLVTMATPEEWQRFKEIMEYGSSRFYKLPVFVGLRLTDFIQASVKALYTDVWEWVDNRSAFFKNLTLSFSNSKPQCAYYTQTQPQGMLANRCDGAVKALYICEFSKPNYTEDRKELIFPTLKNNASSSLPENLNMFACPSGELTHEFLACDQDGPCDVGEMSSCEVNAMEIPMFVCERGIEQIPYTFVCDHRNQCPDYSDESFCEFPSTCPYADSYRCRNKQCIPKTLRCDGMPHCTDSSDENCGSLDMGHFPPLTPPPFIVDMSGKGNHSLRAMKETDACPETHFECPGGMCLPVYLRCNGFDDCPGREDERGCNVYPCPGFYQCRGSAVCLHPRQVCDGVFQCPEQDDELLCDMVCPDGCRCLGLSFVCPVKLNVSSYPFIRYLDASRSGITADDVAENSYLIRLHLAFCGLKEVPNLTLPNLRHLDLSHNAIGSVSMAYFKHLKNLQELVLSHNPLATFEAMSDPGKFNLPRLERLDLSHTDLQVYDGQVLQCCKNLKTLNISSSELKQVTKEGFETTEGLEHLDLSNAPLDDFPLDMLKKMNNLETIRVDNYKLCCEATLPDKFDAQHCSSQQDDFASCEDLLQSDVYRVFLWLFATLSLCGNAGSFATRLYLHKEGSASMGSFGIFVTNLSLADLFMGMYLTMIGTADEIYRGNYLWKEEIWKSSVTCNIAGFLSLLSNEVSAFFICLITLDRFLVLRFPFSRVHFNKKTALVASGVAWGLGVVLATVPLLPWTSHWEFYGQSGICIPLPFSMSSRFQGYRYSFGVVIVLNFVLFALIAVGQIVIYYSVRANTMSCQKTGSRDATIARRLTTIVVSDFLCWFPIGLLGLMAANNVVFPRVVNVGVAIFVLPFNSALNPFLYTFNIIMEKRRSSSEDNTQPYPNRSAQDVRTTAGTEMYRMDRDRDSDSKNSSRTECEDGGRGWVPGQANKDAAVSQLEAWLRNKVLSPEDVVSCLVPLANCQYNAEHRTLCVTVQR